MEVADRIVLMNHGRVEQVGSQEEVYEHPANPFVYGFLGSVNLFHGRVHGDQLQVDEHVLTVDQHTLPPDSHAVACARPHEFEIVRLPEGEEGGGVPGVIKRIYVIGPMVRLELGRLGESGQVFEVEITQQRYRELALNEGEQVWALPRKVRVFATGKTEG